MALAQDTGAQLELARRLEADGRAGEATDILRRAAAGRTAAALAALGKHLLIHRPDCAGDGLAATTAAVKAGDGEAAHLLAVFIAAGIGFRQSWQAALGALQHSAELGWKPAQRELALLAGVEPHLGMDWNQLRSKVDIGAWLAAPPARGLIASPRIFAVERFASPAICDWLVGLARPFLKPAATYDPATGATHYESTRTNSDCHLILPHSDLVLALLRARMANVVGVPVSYFEIPTVLHYRPGEIFAPHHDFLDDNFPAYAQKVAEGGQRVLTFLLYLNDDFAGGETEFPLVQIRYKGRKGDALFFWNVLSDGTLDRQTLHAGLPPLSGEKWLLSQWVRNRAV